MRVPTWSAALRTGVGRAAVLTIAIVIVAMLVVAAQGASGQRLVTVAMINVVIVVGIGIFTGNSGVISFGHIGFAGMGAYTVAILSATLASKARRIPNAPFSLATVQLHPGVAVLVALAGVLVGVLLFGAGPLITLSGSQIGLGDGLLRLLLAALYVAVGLAALGMIGLFISTLTEQPIAATVATAMVSTLLWILDAVPQLDWLHPWLLVDRWSAFIDLLRDPVFTDRMVTGLWVDIAYGAVFLFAAWLRFRVKDITS